MSASRSALVLRAKGVLLLALVGGLVALSIAVYNKSFSDPVRVVVQVERAGLQLNPQSDVRMRGALVGRVDSLDVEGDHAIVRLDIDRDVADKIPDNVRARIVPTTLFGQKYVDLVTVGEASSEPIADNAVITVDRSNTAVELNEALDDIEPLLAAVRPQDLSMTLEALATGLEGRGEQLGENVERVASYLARLNPELPLMIRDLRAFARTAHLYADVTPDLLRLLGNGTVTAETVLALRSDLRKAYAALTGLADDSRAFFVRHGDAIVRVNRLSRPVLELLARYSPEFVCLLDGLVAGNREASKVFRDGKLMLSATFGKEMRGYTADDRPILGDVGTGPGCQQLPNPQPPLLAPKSRDGATLEPLLSLPGGN